MDRFETLIRQHESISDFSLPPEIRSMVLRQISTSPSTCLSTLSTAARTPGAIEYLFLVCEPAFPDLANRWVDFGGSLEDVTRTLNALAAVLPLATYLKSIATVVLQDSHLREILDSPTVLGQTDHVRLTLLLQAIFRLLSFDRDGFDCIFPPIFFTSLLKHESRAIRVLAVECLSLVLHLADACSENLLRTYAGTDPVLGQWEGSTIDYRLLKLWEERRWTRLASALETCRNLRAQDVTIREPVQQDLLHPNTARMGDVLVPSKAPVLSSLNFVLTETSTRNISALGQELLHSKSVLVAGPAGSGKTAMLLEAARLLNKKESLITLHLNEQTDAKSLIGLYVSSPRDGSFIWQPGVLTRAVQQGRWVLIEDIDRAPAEVLGVLRPLIENGSLFIPGRRQRVNAGDGFRIIATLRTVQERPRTVSSQHDWLTSKRLWSIVATQTYPLNEIAELIAKRYPELQSIGSTIIGVHERLLHLYHVDSHFKAAQGRPPAVRDLLKWCRRLSNRLNELGLKLRDTSPIPETFMVDAFRDALGCHGSHLSDPFLYSKVAQSIAEVMNIPPQQTEFHLTPSENLITESAAEVKIGRSSLSKLPTRKSASRRRPFASTISSRRILDNIAAMIASSEPGLLVGETGVGKTSLVQHIASIVGQNLTVVNLSQQSEASDLLGGMKPVTTRSLVIPMVEIFDALFDDTFSTTRNEQFQSAVNKAVLKENWIRLFKLWQEALRMADKALNKPVKEQTLDGPTLKKRKVDTPKYESLRERWLMFSNEVTKAQGLIERGDKNQTFAFVEGRLVQAVRNGEWLLLDEINLASSDTLDHVVSLLENGDVEKPSLLLAEAGSVEKVVAHPNFRVFAAMNPATDAGKKDLPPALRAYFTELYVHAGDDNAEDLVRIIQSYLRDNLNSDHKAALDLARTYLEVQKLNQDNRLTDGAGDAPHFSIRSLVRCLLYVIQHVRSHGLRGSMYEGFAMSFSTSLSRESEALCLPIIEKHLLSNVKNLKSFLAQRPSMSDLISKGPLQIDEQPHYILTPSVKRNLMNLARAASMQRFPILLQGPTSAGKTSMVEYLAKLSGNKFIRINNHEHTDLQEYLGSYGSDSDGKLRFKEGVLVDALRKGHWIVLDELNLAPSDVLEALNRLLDDNRELLIPETQEIVRPHPNFMLFATQNPAGLYGGRKRFSRAFRNRFLEIHFDDIPEDELEIILRERAQIAPSFCTRIVAVYKKLSLLRQSARLFEQRNSFATLRDLFRWASRPVDDVQQLARHGFMLLAERVREPSERALVKNTIEETMKIRLDESSLYGDCALPKQLAYVDGIVWTAAMRRLYVLVSEAVKNNEPVLLVGETGCGKTQICQVVAKAFERPLNIYNAHTNTETGDLIGSQRPVRSRGQLAADVIGSVQSLVAGNPNGNDNNNGATDVEDLIAKFAALDAQQLDSAAVNKARNAIAAYRSLFVWSDGNLVRAMKAGEHFLLDEISLADDSVLERLNSVLEPGRTIVLAEKGSADNVVVAQPDFQFLSTMNPGGDYGKRELSAALRNRMTEIWVPPLTSEDDVLPIVTATLKEDAKFLAPFMLRFAAWFKSTFNSDSRSTIPLRDLLAWTKFINTQSGVPLEVAFVHGAGLVFLDSVGANPAGMTTSAIVDVVEARSQCLEMLQRLVSTDVAEIYNARPELSATEDTVSVGIFNLKRVLGAVAPATDLVFDAPTTLKNTMRIVRALQMDRQVLLEGNPGVGKTAIVTALAQAVGKPFTRVNLSDQTDLMDLFGADAPTADEGLGNFSWQDGPLLQAMQSGGWVLLDEMNLASQSVLEGLNSCLDHRKEIYVAELDKSFSCHPDFRLFAAQNPHHQGGGRKGLPASFVNRFTVVYADPFEADDLMHICKVKYPEVDREHLSTIIRVVAEADRLLHTHPTLQHGGPWEVNLRDVSRWLALSQKRPLLNPMYHFDTIIASRFRDSKQLDTLNGLKDANAGNTPPLSTYARLTTGTLQVGTESLGRSPAEQSVAARYMILPQSLPAVKSIITAIQYGWPTIIIGPADSGKTELTRSLAALSGNKLVEISMNADIDTMDLLGGFEQYDPVRELEVIRRNISDTLFEVVIQNLDQVGSAMQVVQVLAAWQTSHNSILTAESLLSVISDLQLPTLEPYISKLQDMSKASASSRSQFVWNDGVLVDAIQDGSWVVLDNANLCNASVLDRLNSLLESDGHLVISEQHSNDGAGARVVRPHPNFRIFLTVDPKYGELSRAMRNRSLEVYFPASLNTDVTAIIPTYHTRASMSRLRELQIGQDRLQDNADIFYDNLAPNDLQLLQTMGFHDVGDHSIVTDANNPPQTNERHQDILRVMMQQNEEAEGEDLAQVDDQPMLSLLNEPRYSVNLQGNGVVRLQPLFRLWQVLKVLDGIRLQMQTVVSRSETLPLKELSVLERSAAAARNKRTTSSQLPPVFAFVQAVLLQLDRGLTSLQVVDSAYTTASATLVNFIVDLLGLVSGKELDLAQFQAFLQIGHSTYKRLEHGSAVADGFQRNLQMFSVARLSYGQGLQRIWQIWSPQVPQNKEQLQWKLALETLLDRFDSTLAMMPQKRADFVQVKSRLLDAASSVWQSSDADSVVNQLTSSVRHLEEQFTGSRQLPSHFGSAFHQIWTKLQTQRSATCQEAMTGLMPFINGRHILASFPAQKGPASKILATIATLSGRYDEKGAATTTEVLSGVGLAHALPLRALQSTHDEISVILRTLSLEPYVLTRSALNLVLRQTRDLLTAILESHIELLPAAYRSIIGPDGQIDHDALLKVHFDASDHSSDGAWFSALFQHHLLPTIRALHHCDNENLPVQTREAGLSLMQVATAALMLTVPDKPFDPALLPQIECERHGTRIKEVERQIEAQSVFDLRTTGRDGSLVGRLLRLDLHDLGSSNKPISVARPERSSLGRVQEEFNVIIKNILQSPTLIKLLSSEYADSDEKELGRLRQVAEHIRARLSQLDRAYDDVVVLVRQLLSCLVLGIEMTQHENSETTVQSKAVLHAPLMGHGPLHVDQWPLQGLKKNEQDRLQWLRHYSLRAATGKEHKLEDYLTVMDSFYVQWKERLQKDQADAESKSRYYAYREDENEDPESEGRQMAELFPIFDNNEDSDSTESARPDTTAKLVSELADIHQTVFSDTKGAVNHIDFLLNLSKNTDHTSLQNALPILFLRLESQIQNLSHRADTEPFNIYTDHHVQEIGKLQVLVRNVQSRFAQIHQQWPEHAVPVEAATVCGELLDFALDTPLAKLLTKTEKLLEITAQWQSVASKEWSVASLMEEITALIVSWRRLELSSWSRLLDFEKQNHDEHTASWFFIAYEALIHEPRLLVDADGDVAAYCRKLISTLEDFFKNATVGQFYPRLRLLQSLGNTMSSMAHLDERLRPVGTSVANVLTHYARYASNTEKSLGSGRAELEKAIIEQIKLASWKDTNVTALKDSARRTHHKLFKIVKKYRALLNQPINTFKAEELSTEFREQEVVLRDAVSEEIEPSLYECANAFPDWKDRPARLTNPSTSTLGMKRVYLAQQDGLDLQVELETFRTDLVQSIQDLRKETPSTMTEDNTAAIKHLRERKRRLLADTIKEVTHMGVRRNLPVSDLEMQSSTASVLSRVASVQDTQLFSKAQDALHDLLDSIPTARKAVREHSADLTDGEVQRGLGLLEGLLFQGLCQRQDVASFAAEVGALRDKVSELSNLHPRTAVKLASGAPKMHSSALDVRLRWLPAILDTSIRVLTIQANHAELNLQALIDDLTTMADNLEAIRSERADLLHLPPGLVHQATLKLDADAEHTFLWFEDTLRRWQQAEPNVNYLVQQLLLWARFDGPANDKIMVNGINHLALSSVDQAVRELVDSIFVALQQLSSTKTKTVQDTEGAGWLIRNDKHFHESAQALHIAIINQKLASILSNLQHLRTENLSIAISLLTVTRPVVEQFYFIAAHCLTKQVAVHVQTLWLACFLAKSFTTVATEGFCTPPDPRDGQEQSGQLESGTGLGDGEGAEDISKDVGADEDLSEFAQGQQDDQEGEMEDAEAAVDMGADDLEGKTGDSGERENEDGGDNGSDAEEQDEMDEETGSVDDLDPTTVDEKMWDEAQKDDEKDEKELKGQKQKGEKTQEQTESGGEKAEGDNEGKVDDAEGVDEEMHDENEDPGETKAQAENADPHLQDQEVMELPEELQLNGEEDKKEGGEEDDDMSGLDDLSDVDQAKEEDGREEVDSVGSPDREEVGDAEQDEEAAADEEVEGAALDDEVVPDQELDKDQDEDLQQREGEMELDQDDDGGGDQGAANRVQDEIDPEQKAEGQNQIEQGLDDKDETKGASSADNKELGETGSKGVAERGTGRDDNMDRQQREAIRKLADVLEQWHQRREILNPSEEQQDNNGEQDVEMNDADFEHLDGEDEDADAQALGAAGTEQAQNPDMTKAIQDDNVPIDEDSTMPDPQQPESEEVQASERLNRLQANANDSCERREDGAFVPEQTRQRNIDIANDVEADTESEISETAADVQTLDLTTRPSSPNGGTTHSAALQLWQNCSQLTHAYSLILTEQLRLILHPTTATKLRGDYRSGKRLNLKRIIPYIASGYKRDKIWMRRSVPSKRNYQILLAIDDSKSMAESGADVLALQTVAMLCKSLSMLEVGEVGVVGFGDSKAEQAGGVKVAHKLGNVWRGEDSGVGVFENLGFRQEGTDVKLLMKEALHMLGDARARKMGGVEGELWQLMIIVSDGHCGEHEEVRRLVRQGKGERVMVVFIVLDNINTGGTGTDDDGAAGGGQSILDLKEAVFEKGADGEMKVVTRRYLERFPFEYYLVVRDVRELPGVLARCLKGWFGEVSGN